jgi:hypothetical protein
MGECSVQSKTPLSDSFPAGMQAAARDLTGFAAPLILVRVFRAAAGIVRPEKKFRSIRRSISESGAPHMRSLRKSHFVCKRSQSPSICTLQHLAVCHKH